MHVIYNKIGCNLLFWYGMVENITLSNLMKRTFCLYVNVNLGFAY